MHKDAGGGLAAQLPRPAPRPPTRYILVVVTAPEQVKHQIKLSSTSRARVRVCARLASRRQTTAPPSPTRRRTLRHLARRYRDPRRGDQTNSMTEIRRLCAEGEPGTVSSQRCRPRHRFGAAGRRRRQPRTDALGEAPSRRCAAPAPSRHHQDKRFGIVSTRAATAKPTRRYGEIATTRMRTDTCHPRNT